MNEVRVLRRKCVDTIRLHLLQTAKAYPIFTPPWLKSISMMFDSINYTMAMNVSNSWDAVKMTENYEQVVGGLIFQR